jgi:hypothetical protein
MKVQRRKLDSGGRVRWQVRTPDGELTFPNFGEVERAYVQGLIEPDDELLEEGSTKWRKARSFPILAQTRRPPNAVWQGTQKAWVFLFLVLGFAALYCFQKGMLLVGLALAMVVGLLLTRITYKAYKRTRPHG